MQRTSMARGVVFATVTETLILEVREASKRQQLTFEAHRPFICRLG